MTREQMKARLEAATPDKRPRLTKPQQSLLEEISAPGLEDGGLYVRTSGRDMRTAVALVEKGYATRHWTAGMGSGWELFKPAPVAPTDLAKLHAALDAVEAMHRQDTYGPKYCICGDSWPCATVRAIRDALGEDGQ